MKRIILITIAVLMAMPVFAQGAEFRKKLREIKKEGWELFGSSKTIKAALHDHYDALAADGTFEVVGTATGIKSETIGRQVAWNNACINYVQQAGSFLRGRIDTDSHIGGGLDGEFNHFYSAYETLLQKEIRGELVPYITAIRDKRGRIAARAYCIVDLDAAYQLRRRALEIALEEQSLAEQYGSMVSS